MLANSIALLTLAVMLASEARRAEGGWRAGLYTLATVVALVALALKPITDWLPAVGTTLTGIFGSPLAWFILVMGLYFALRPFWIKRPEVAAAAAGANMRSLGQRAGTIARRISDYRSTGRLWRDRLPPLIPIVLDGSSLLLSFEKAGFAVPHFQTNEAERLAVGLQHYFTIIYPLIRDGHEEIARAEAAEIADASARAATTFNLQHWWQSDDF